MRISVLPTHLSYDAPWPVRKVPLRCTPHHLAYHTDSKTYSVCSSVSEPCNRLVKVAGEGEKEFESVEKGVLNALSVALTDIQVDTRKIC